MKIQKWWSKLEYWQKGATIGSLSFFLILITISFFYFLKDTHSDMDGLVFLLVGAPLILVTTIPTGFQENAITSFLIDTGWPYIFFSSSFLVWAGLGALMGKFVKKLVKK